MSDERHALDEELEARLAAWLDGELAPDEARLLEELLASRPELGARAEAIRRTLGLIRAVPPPQGPAPEETLAAVQRRLRRKSRGRQGLAGIQQTGFESLGLVALLVGVLLAAQTLLFSSQTEFQVGPQRLALHPVTWPGQALLAELGAGEDPKAGGCGPWELALEGPGLQRARLLLPTLSPLEQAALERGLASSDELLLTLYPGAGSPGCGPGPAAPPETD